MDGPSVYLETLLPIDHIKIYVQTETKKGQSEIQFTLSKLFFSQKIESLLFIEGKSSPCTMGLRTHKLFQFLKKYFMPSIMLQYLRNTINKNK